MGEKRWFWATLTLSSITIVSIVLAAWELAENRFFRNADYLTLHYLYITRGVASSLLLAFWAAWFVSRQKRKSEEDLRRSRERYRGLLEAFPGAVILYDSAMLVLEWNASAERIYGYPRAEICGQRLPIVPAAKAGELEEFMRRVERGDAVLDVETLRQAKDGDPFEVQLSLLPFRESAGPLYFLEVTSDIRERVQWRRRMVEIEKLTSMGKMAAGTAHHLNSPLAALLIRVQMMRQRAPDRAFDEDAARIEEGLHFCRHFVQRLLDFTRATPMLKEPQDLGAIVESVAGFFLPAIKSKRVSLVVDASEGKGQHGPCRPQSHGDPAADPAEQCARRGAGGRRDPHPCRAVSPIAWDSPSRTMAAASAPPTASASSSRSSPPRSRARAPALAWPSPGTWSRARWYHRDRKPAGRGHHGPASICRWPRSPQASGERERVKTGMETRGAGNPGGG